MFRVLPPANQTCLATIRLLQVAKSCGRKWGEVLLFATKSVQVARFTGQGKLVWQQVTKCRVWPDSCLILSNQ